MADDAFLAGLDPPALLDREAERLDVFFAALPGGGWSRPSRCDGWTVRDVLAHLTSSEEYHHACLDGTVAVFLADFAAKGATDVDAATAIAIAGLADVSTGELLDRWRDADVETRQGYRQRGDGTVDTSVGEYPARWQACHVALELATHADDIGVPVTDDERRSRLDWMARVSCFALAEAKPDAVVSHTHGGTHVRIGAVDLTLDDNQLVAAVAARLDDSSGLDARTRAALSTMP